MQYIYHKNEGENYTQISNDLLNDPALDITLIGLLVVLLSNRADWRIYPEEIAKRTGFSRATVDKYFKKLEEAGYMRTVIKSRGYKKGRETYRFVADFKFEDWYFEEYVMSKFEKERQKHPCA